MNYTNNIKKFTILVLFLFQFASICPAQTAKISEPRQEKLLNGLKLLVWNEPKAEKITVKLRIHSGSAFDPRGKEGVTALLADALFPNEAQREFFAEDLGGSLDVTSNFDYIQINATGNSDQFLTIIETLATAVTNPQINKEITAKIVSARLEKVKELEKNPAYIADQAVAKRLFGDFPYGRAQAGTSASLAKIDFADLLFARQRLLTADNATLAVSGNVKHDLAFRAVRRYFGAWEKADKKVPATFRQPDAADTKPLTIELPNAGKHYYRLAQMAVGRNDKDFFATRILTLVRQKQLCLDNESKGGVLKLESYLLRSVYRISESIEFTNDKSIAVNNQSCLSYLTEEGNLNYPRIEQGVFNEAKAKAITELQQKMQTTLDLTELWLGIDTYKLVSVKDEIQKVNNITLADVQRVAENLQKQPVVSIVVKKSGEAKQ